MSCICLLPMNFGVGTVDLLNSNYYRTTWEKLRKMIYENPERLDDIIADLKVRLQGLRKPNGEPRYTERTIDRIIKRLIEEFYD